MLKWSQLLQHQGLLEQLSHCYSFPIEVRQYLHDWLEEQPWHLLEPNNPTREQKEKAAEMLRMTIAKLRSKVMELNGGNHGLQRTRLEQAACSFKTQYQHNALAFVQMMKKCLEQETLLLQALLGQDKGMMKREQVPSPACSVNRERLISDGLQELHAAKERMEMIALRMQDNSELNNCLLQRRSLIEQRDQVRSHSVAVQGQLQSVTPQHTNGGGGGGVGEAGGELHQQLMTRLQAVQTKQRELETRAEQIDSVIKAQLQLRNELGELYQSRLPVVEQMLKLVVEEEIGVWKRNQQLSSNGGLSTDDSDLDRLQYWCECLAEVLILMHQQIQQWDSNHGPPMGDNPLASSLDFLGAYRSLVRKLLMSLVSGSLIVERQPDQVVQQNSYFNANLRLLVARKLNMAAPFPKVKASILSEEEARRWRTDPNQVGDRKTSSFILKNNEAPMEFLKDIVPSPSLHPQGGPLCAQFRMQLDSHRPRARHGQYRVTKLKFCFRFQTSVNVEGIPLDLQVLSLPVVVTVHGSQKCQAVATILWDNAFALPQREGFEVPGSVPWSQLAEQLQVNCEKLIGRRMTCDHLQFLADKIFGIQGCDSHQSIVSMSQFCERPLQEHGCKIREKKKGKRRCTFWDWFYDAVHLIEKRLKGLWEDGYIEGFVSKVRAQEILKDQEEGTFLFRFSDSECGALSIAFVERKDGCQWVSHTEPMDLDYLNLADTIRGRNRLVTLYPNIPKDDAFTRYYTPKQEKDPKSSYLPLPYATSEAPCSSDSDYMTPLHSEPSPFSGDADHMIVSCPEPSPHASNADLVLSNQPSPFASSLPPDLEDMDMASLFKVVLNQ
ncbi:hypothetical protein ACOMHN_030227 [Nucella lapillus]